MDSIRAQAPAKLNLTFDILGTLADGYHDVQTLLQAIDLKDDIVVSAAPASRRQAAQPEITLSLLGDRITDDFPLDERNLMHAAARLFFAHAAVGSDWQVHIAIDKLIPIGAGLAGGSADAAAVLLSLNELFQHPLAASRLTELGTMLGADVPFCLSGGTAVGTGRGDVLRTVKPSVEFAYCVVKPRHLSVSTLWAYQQYDAFSGDIARPDIQAAEHGLLGGDIEQALSGMGNVFEPVIFAQYPELAALKKQLLDAGCWHCQLSGSGPSLFAVVADREQAHFVRRKLLKTDELEFVYTDGVTAGELGAPLEFFIAQSSKDGILLQPNVMRAHG